MRTFRLFRLATLAAVAALVALTGSPAFAHSVVEMSLPPANTSLDTSPRDVVVNFSESIDAAFSTVAVLDRDGRQVSSPAVFARDGRRVVVPLSALRRGIYTVRWRVLSSVDGHTTTGFFAFAVGQAIAADLEAVQATAPSAGIVFFRWVGLLAAIVLAGSAFFQIGILHPGLARGEPSETLRLARDADAHLRTLTVIGGWVLLASLAGEFTLQGMLLLDTPLRALIGSGALWRLLATTRAGWGVLARASMGLVLLLPPTPSGRVLRIAALLWFVIVGGIAVLLGGLSAFASTHVALLVLVASVYGLFSALMALILPQIPDVRIPQARWVAPCAGALLLAGITITAHASGSGPLAVIADWLHLVAVAVWIGGLVSFLLILALSWPADRALVARTVVSRFSTAAGASLAVLIVTGIYSAWLYLPGLQAFRVTPYGRELLLKLLLILPLVALGALNRFVLRPRLAGGDARSSRPLVHRLLSLVTAESVLGITVLLVVAVLTITPPARVSMPAVAQQSLKLAGIAGSLRVRLTITPAVPGWNRIEVEVTDAEGTPLTADNRILLRLTKLDEDLDRFTLPLSLRQNHQYVVEGAQVALPGWWEVDVVVRRRGLPDTVTGFPLRLGDEPTPRADAQALTLVDQARSALGAIRTWHQVDQIADGIGDVIVTSYDMVRPDRLHYRTSLGGEVVLIGNTRYVRENSPTWQKDTTANPLALKGPYLEYLAGAQDVRLGRQLPCEMEPCQVVVWEAPGRVAAFAGWIGLRTYQVHKLLMAAPAHYMTSQPSDFDGRIEITPPR